MKDNFVIRLNMTMKEWSTLSFFTFSHTKIFKRGFFYFLALQLFIDVYSLPSEIRKDGWSAKNLLLSVIIVLIPTAFVVLGTLLIGLIYPPVRQGIVARYSADSVEITRGNKHERLFWRQFGRLIETDSFFFLSFTVERNNKKHEFYHPILKRAFADGQELEEFRVFLHKQLPLSA